MNVELIDFESAGMLHPITRAYLKQEPQTHSFYQFAPTFSGLEDSLKQRKSVPINRSVLVTSLNAQYQGYKAPKQVISAISELASNNTFTIVTGHQLNLFTDHFILFTKLLR